MLRSIVTAALVCLASPVLAGECLEAKVLPPNSASLEPNVPYRIFNVTPAKIETMCGLGVIACTYKTGKAWTVLLPNDTDLAEYACLVRYEKAHLPPNNWGDPNRETPQGMALLANGWN